MQIAQIIIQNVSVGRYLMLNFTLQPISLMKRFILSLGILILFANCDPDYPFLDSLYHMDLGSPGPDFNYDTNIFIALKNTESEDILDPNTSDVLDWNQIRIIRKIGNEYYSEDEPMYGFRIYKLNAKNTYVFDTKLIPEYSGSKSSLTIIDWGDSKISNDTLISNFTYDKLNINLVKLEINGEVVYDKDIDGDECFIELIKDY